jgi:hypothetical protein
VISTTSSARTSRRPFVGRIAAAAAGSTAASLACSGRRSGRCELRPRAGRVRPGSVPGNSSGSSAARTYSPEPPTSRGTPPRASMSSMTERACCW